jgi:hypothetical protein
VEESDCLIAIGDAALPSHCYCINDQIIYLTNPCMETQYSSDRPVNTKKAAYLPGFFGAFLCAGLCGAGGVLSILRSTSSGRGIGLGSCAIAGV